MKKRLRSSQAQTECFYPKDHIYELSSMDNFGCIYRKKKQAAARPKTGNEKLKPKNIKSGHKACGKKDCG